MEMRDSDRISTRLLAIDLRLHELSMELNRAHLRIQQLEARLEDARLAHLLGETAGDTTELHPELEAWKQERAERQEQVDQLKKSQWQARVQHVLARSQERREEREAAAQAPGDVEEPA